MAVGYRELHRTGRISWLRPAVLGANGLALILMALYFLLWQRRVAAL